MPDQPPKTIYIDASALRGAGWPLIGANLTELLDLATALEVRIVIPVLALTELRELDRRDRSKDRSKLQSSIKALSRRLQHNTLALGQLPDDERFEAHYVELVEQMLERFKVQKAGLPGNTLEDLIEMSAAHKPPFRDADAGFRDSIIAMSVAEDEVNGGARNAVLLTVDGGFSAHANYLEEHGVRVERDDARLRGVLRGALSAAAAQLYAARVNELKAAVSADLAGVNIALAEKLEVPEFLEGLAAMVAAVDRVEAIRVTSAAAGFSFELVGATKERGFAELEVRLSLLVKPFAFGRSRVFRVGSEIPEAPQDNAFAGDYEEQQFLTKATIEFEVWRNPEGALAFEYGDCYLGDSGTRLVQQITRQRLRAMGGR